MRSLLLASFGLLLIIAINCTASVDLDGLNDGSGGGAATATNGAGGNATTSVGGSPPGAGGVGGTIVGAGGGDIPCDPCGAYLNDFVGVITLADMCGYDPNSGMCAPSAQSSCNRLVQLIGCACGDMPGTGPCETQCQLLCSRTGTNEASCMNCLSLNCGSQLFSCNNDPGSG